MRIFFALVIIQTKGPEVVGIFHEQLQRFFAVLASSQGIAEDLRSESTAIHRDNFHCWTNPSSRDRHALDSVDNLAVFFDEQPDRIRGVNLAVVLFAGADHLAPTLVVHHFPSAAFDATKWSMRVVSGEALRPETTPIIGDNLVKGIHDVIEGIGLHHGRGTGSAVEEVAEIVDRLLALGLLANDGVGPQPVEFTFLIEIRASAPRLPLMRSEVEFGSKVRGVLQ